MSQFVNLCLEGGGVKGIAYAGALKVLEERDIVPGLKRVAGTSAGAISATLIAMGADSKQVHAIVGGTNFHDFMDGSWGYIRDICRLLTRFGWYKGDAFSQWMQKNIHSLTDNGNLTFKELQSLDKANPAKFKELSVVGTNLTRQKPEIYNAENTPHMPIWQAVRISMSIPLFFAAYFALGKEVRVDGGVTWNYPLDIYDRQKYLSVPSNQSTFSTVDYPTLQWEDQIYNKETLGLRVDTKDEIAAQKHRQAMPPLKIKKFPDYAKAIIGFMTDMANKAHLHKNDWHRSVFIDALGVNTTDFDLSKKQIQELVDSGEKCTNAYFDWLDSAAPGEALNKI